MDAIERRSFQRKGWLGLAGLAAIPIVGVLLLSASLSLFFGVLISLLLCGAVVAGIVLLRLQLRAGKSNAPLVTRVDSRSR